MKVIVTYKKLADREPISFTILKGKSPILQCTGTICAIGEYNFVSLEKVNNDAVFNALGLNPTKFVQEITGEWHIGRWPESTTLDNLGKVLEALQCFHEL